jgi:RNA ligase (TIGR02306 family)
MSEERKIEVVPIELRPHPNADSLSLVNVFDAYQVCVRTSDWVGVSKAAYVPPNNILPDKPEYAFLQGKLRIRAMRLRGEISQGLLVPVPDECQIGDDVTELLGITHYDPEVHLGLSFGSFRDDEAPAPPMSGPKYDIESWFKYRRVFEDLGDIEVTLTEKIHGTNTRFTYQNGSMHVASRQFYRKYDANSLYWKALEQSPWLEAFCRANEGAVIYAEIFGWVQDLKYGATKDDPLKVRVFDMYRDGLYQNFPACFDSLNSEHIVPVFYRGTYSHEIVEKFISGDTTIPGAKHVREGVVIKPTIEQWHRKLGRVILKAVSPLYLEKSK